MILSGMAAIARKELRHIYRDKQILFMTMIAPAFVLFLLAYTFAADTQLVRIGLMDRDQSSLSRRYADALQADGFVRIVGYPSSHDEAESLLRRNEARMVIVVPPGFGDSLLAGRPEPLQAIVDASDYAMSRSAYANLSQRTAAFAEQLLAEGAPATIAPVDVQIRGLYNPSFKWIHAMVPGLMAAAYIFPAISVALACTRELEHGSYEGLLATPIRIHEYILGKLLPYLALGMVGTLLGFALAIYWFKVPFRAHLWEYAAVTALFLLALMSLSTLVGMTAGNQRQAVIIIVLIFFIPTMFMSGLLSPLTPGAPLTTVVQHVLPASNYVAINRALFLKGVGLADLAPACRRLAQISAVALAASIAFSRRRVA